MPHRLTTNYAKNYCNRTLIVKVIVENVVTFFGTQCTERAKKGTPRKIRYLWNGSKFFLQIYSAYRGGFRPHILQNSSQYLVAFKNYSYLNLNVHFQSE